MNFTWMRRMWISTTVTYIQYKYAADENPLVALKSFIICLETKPQYEYNYKFAVSNENIGKFKFFERKS